MDIGFNIVPETIEGMLTRETITHEEVRIMKVKKPDYLGESQWEFRFAGAAISAKIAHQEWLRQFQNREINVRPGDGLRVKLEIIVSYDHNNDVIEMHHRIIEVLDVIPPEQIGRWPMVHQNPNLARIPISSRPHRRVT